MLNQSAFLFPGQGSQSVGMLASLATQYPELINTFTEASEVFGEDLWRICQQGPAQTLNQTAITQPALLTAGVSLWRLWRSRGGALPVYMAGHSLGEYTALVCAEALDFKTAVALVRQRGQYMQEAVPMRQGAMAAIVGLANEEVEELCQLASAGEILAPANYNSVGQVVVAGHVHAVQRLLKLAEQKGAKLAVLLPVSVPSHCLLMKPAAELLAKEFAEITLSSPKIPVIHNVDVSTHSEPEAIKTALILQLHHPVRWVETIQKLQAANIGLFFECGPGKVLAGLNKRIDRSLTTMNLDQPESFSEA